VVVERIRTEGGGRLVLKAGSFALARLEDGLQVTRLADRDHVGKLVVSARNAALVEEFQLRGVFALSRRTLVPGYVGTGSRVG